MTKPTRRRFLEDSLLAAAALSAAGPSRLLAAEKKRSRGRYHDFLARQARPPSVVLGKR